MRRLDCVVWVWGVLGFSGREEGNAHNQGGSLERWQRSLAAFKAYCYNARHSKAIHSTRTTLSPTQIASYLRLKLAGAADMALDGVVAALRAEARMPLLEFHRALEAGVPLPEEEVRA